MFPCAQWDTWPKLLVLAHEERVASGRATCWAPTLQPGPVSLRLLHSEKPHLDYKALAGEHPSLWQHLQHLFPASSLKISFRKFMWLLFLYSLCSNECCSEAVAGQEPVWGWQGTPASVLASSSLPLTKVWTSQLVPSVHCRLHFHWENLLWRLIESAKIQSGSRSDM